MMFLPRLRNFLREHGTIYTVRSYNARPAWVDVEGIGRCRRTPLGEVHVREDLEFCVSESGFSDVESWWSKIEEFIVPGQEMYLYRVEVR